MTSRDYHQIAHVALVSEQRSRVCDLAGFKKKTHQVPSEVTDRAQSFVGRIAARDIGNDLDARFAEFRQHFQFKRVELRVSDPENGCGMISTPWFDYRVTVTLSPDDASEAVWRRQVTDFRHPEPLLSPEFATVFGNLFNTVEFEPPEPIDVEDFIDAMEDRSDTSMQIDYDRTATWCQLSIESLPGQLKVENDRVAFVTSQPQLPAQLLDAFFRYREQLKGIECF